MGEQVALEARGGASYLIAQLRLGNRLVAIAQTAELNHLAKQWQTLFGQSLRKRVHIGLMSGASWEAIAALLGFDEGTVRHRYLCLDQGVSCECDPVFIEAAVIAVWDADLEGEPSILRQPLVNTFDARPQECMLGMRCMLGACGGRAKLHT